MSATEPVCLPMRSGDVTHHLQSWDSLLFMVLALVAKDRISSPEFIFLFFVVIVGSPSSGFGNCKLDFSIAKKRVETGSAMVCGCSRVL